MTQSCKSDWKKATVSPFLYFPPTTIPENVNFHNPLSDHRGEQAVLGLIEKMHSKEERFVKPINETVVPWPFSIHKKYIYNKVKDNFDHRRDSETHPIKNPKWRNNSIMSRKPRWPTVIDFRRQCQSGTHVRVIFHISWSNYEYNEVSTTILRN